MVPLELELVYEKCSTLYFQLRSGPERNVSRPRLIGSPWAAQLGIVFLLRRGHGIKSSTQVGPESFAR